MHAASVPSRQRRRQGQGCPALRSQALRVHLPARSPVTSGGAVKAALPRSAAAQPLAGALGRVARMVGELAGGWRS